MSRIPKILGAVLIALGAAGILATNKCLEFRKYWAQS